MCNASLGFDTLLRRGLGEWGRDERKGEGEKEGGGTSASDCTQYGGQQGVDTTWPRLWTKIFNTT